MLIWILIALNIPVYLFIGWLAFDTKDSAADTFFETIVVILKIVFVPRLIRVLAGWDDTDAIGVFPIIAFFLACGAVVYGEHWLIEKYFPSMV